MCWSEITREERFFTAYLFHEVRMNPRPFEELLSKILRIAPNVQLREIGFEVCYFRDGHRKGLIDRHPDREKQTFDFFLWLSDGSGVIIEAKAHQGFNTKHIRAR